MYKLRELKPKKVLSHTSPCDYIDILRALLLVSLIQNRYFMISIS